MLNPVEISTGRLGLPVRTEGGGDYSVIELPGIKHFGLWTLADAARSTFGIDEWPTYIPRPQATLELEVDDVSDAVDELRPGTQDRSGTENRTVGTDYRPSALTGRPSHRHYIHNNAAGRMRFGTQASRATD